MFAQWWGEVLVQSAIFVQCLVTWDSEAFQSPTTAQTQTLCARHRLRKKIRTNDNDTGITIQSGT
jgi:hypothetical protein